MRSGRSVVVFCMGKLRQRKTKALVQDLLYCQWEDGGPGHPASCLGLLPLAPHGLPWGLGHDGEKETPKERFLEAAQLLRSTEVNCTLGHWEDVCRSQCVLR